MTRNLREIILDRIAEIIRREDYEDLDTYGKRPTLDELEVLNRLLMNIRETDLVNIPDNERKDVVDEYKLSDKNTYISGYFKAPEIPTPCSTCPPTISNLYGQEKH